MKPAPEELLPRGGWRLASAYELHASNPDTFWIPSTEQLDALAEGDYVRAVFHLVDHADLARDGVPTFDDHTGRPNLAVYGERMWMTIEKRYPRGFLCILQNQPTSSHTVLEPGSRLDVSYERIIDVMDRPVELDATLAVADGEGLSLLTVEDSFVPVAPNRPQRLTKAQVEHCIEAGADRPLLPWIGSGIIVSTAVREGARPLYGWRTFPNGEWSGWAITTYDPNTDEPEADPKFEKYILQQVLVEGVPEVWPFIALPPGFSFTLDADGTSRCYPDPELLED